MAQVSVPPEFFRGELRVYGDWRAAFARELFQNATDARPSRIEVRFSDVEVDGQRRGRVQFSDDGHGMSREVLEEVFFALGRTTKTDAASIGGFGRARIIICFAQASYRIRTGSLVVEGHGGEYRIETAPDGSSVRGCEFTIDLLDEDCDAMRRAFDILLNSCSLDVPVFIDGSRYPSQPRPSRATRVLRDGHGQPWAKVYATPYGWGHIQVRVHGLTMFTRWASGEDNIVLELEPSRAREVLAASRDNLHTVYGEQLDEFMAALALNRRKALKAPDAPLDLHLGGGGFLVSDPATSSGGGEDGTQDVSDHGGTSDEEPGRLVPVVPGNAAAYANLHATPSGRQPSLLDMEEPTVPHLGFDVFLLADANDARVRKLVKSWNPAGWDATSGARRRSLLLAWKAAVSECIDTLLAIRPSVGRVAWTVGWTFDADVEAVHRGGDSGHVLALNPVNAQGVTKFSMSSRRDRHRLLSIAAHEVAHIVEADHNERFASLLTGLFGALDTNDADRKIREAARG